MHGLARLIIWPVCLAILAGLSACNFGETPAPIVETVVLTVQPQPPVDLPVTFTPEPTATLIESSQPVFLHEPTGFGFSYPQGWFGPEVYEYEGGVRIEIGSDVVYPYGTGLEERNYTVPDAYYILLQLDTLNAFLPDETFTQLMNMQDGESINDGRGMFIRLQAVTVAGMDGVAYIATTAPSAQTEMFYTRQVVVTDGQGKVLRISGTPNLVDQSGFDSLRQAYQAVDAAYEGVFWDLVSSIEIQ